MKSSRHSRRGILQTTITVFVVSLVLGSSAADSAEVSDSAVPEVDKTAPGVTLERPENPCDQAMARAARLGLPSVNDDEMTESKLAFPWRLSEYAVSFQTDEFDMAQMSTVMTSLVTGRGSYAVKLGLPPHYDRFSASTSGGVQLDGCMPAPAESSVTCTVIGTGRAGCFQLRFRLPPINSARASPRNPNEDRMETLHFFAGTDAFLSPRGKSKIVFTIPGDYSLLAELPGGHKLDPLDADLAVETNFVFDPRTEETTLVVGNGNAGGSTNNTVGVTLYGRATRRMSEHELKQKLETERRAVLHINFDFDKANLRPDAMPAIEQIVALLKHNPGLNLVIEGHTDALGAEKHNRALAEARAHTVKNFIVERGVAADRLATTGFGASRPVADNATEDGRFKNRRVELTRQ